jgi:hypothetical protein
MPTPAADAAQTPAPEHEFVFVLAAKDPLEANAYEEMFAKNGLLVVKELCEPSGRVAASAIRGMGGGGGGSAAPAGVNIYVQQRQLEKARELLDKFENEPVEYRTVLSDYRKKSKANQTLFGFLVFIIFIMPVAIAVAVIILKLAK